MNNFVYTLDTNAIIYYLKGEARVVSILNKIFKGVASVYISTITEVELFGFPNLNEEESKQIEEILKTLAVIPLDSHVARIAGLLRRVYKLKIADAVIPATAMFTGTALVTRNIDDFKNVPNLFLKKI